MNTYFLEKLLDDNHDYWVVAKENSVATGRGLERSDDDVLVIGVPLSIKRPRKIRDVSFGELEDMCRLEVSGNIFFTGNYPPFQIGVTLGSFVRGFPLTGKFVWHELIDSFYKLGSKDIYEYEKLFKELSKQEEK